MTLYLDTSALVKLYVREHETSAVTARVGTTPLIATARVAYPEARAALARRHRERAISHRGLRSAVAALDRDFEQYVVVELVAPVARLAGELSERHALRGFDAIHLASALELRSMTNEPVAFCCFDTRLAEAAVAEGLLA